MIMVKRKYATRQYKNIPCPKVSVFSQSKTIHVLDNDFDDNTFLKDIAACILENNLAKVNKQSSKDENLKNDGILLVGPPILTTSKGFGSTANSSCQTEAALLSAAESA